MPPPLRPVPRRSKQALLGERVEALRRKAKRGKGATKLVVEERMQRVRSERQQRGAWASRGWAQGQRQA